jgi:ribosomal protein L13E
MPSVKSYFANTQTVPVLKTFFTAPLFASMRLHIRPMTITQKYRHVRLKFPCPESIFQELTAGFEHDMKNGIIRRSGYDGEAGRLASTRSTSGANLWDLRIPAGKLNAIDKFFSLELIDRQASGASRLIFPRGQRRRSNGAQKLARATGPLRVQFRQPKVSLSVAVRVGCGLAVAECASEHETSRVASLVGVRVGGRRWRDSIEPKAV